MSDSVVVVVVNSDYLPQMKSLFVSCVRQGGWQGDCCLVAARDCNSNDLEQRGIHVMKSSDAEWSMFTKFHIFSDYFKRWRQVLCLDCDILIQNDLNEVFYRLSKQFPSILFDNQGDNSIVHNWEHFDRLCGTGPEAHPEIYEEMRSEFPHLDETVLTAGVICFDPNTVSKGTVKELQRVANKYLDANLGQIDQPVYNLALYGRMAPISKESCTWFAFDEPANRIACSERGWTGNEFPAVIHYWGMYAPWIKKTPDAGGYYNSRLNRVCHELYAENLSLFDETFPRRGIGG